ncbi:MAG: pectate lyase [Alphaproteobacteria bacterium]|nr:pectate lyase [Alphaproteobacteria bacterium]MDE2164577.1 pectate lyase [Alphaproteobacteria bacterium]MDE2501168.1 pectate lyase [Alphaproteobacteria bacterium]
MRSLLGFMLGAALIAAPANAAPSTHATKDQTTATPASHPLLAFPGAMGWAATTPGGRGGRIIKVTTLNASGPGSLLEALAAKGPRIIVFEVGGVIDLGDRAVQITNPYLTIAGQTAPSPGITLIRSQTFAIFTHDVIVQNLRIRPGDDNKPKAGGYSTDGVRTGTGSYNIIIDHCSVSWATNKNFAVAGPRFDGKDVEEWRANTSHRVTVSNNLISEALSRSTHWKIEHSKGALVHDNTTDILFARNIFAQNYERSPLFKGGVHAVMINNVIYDPGQRAVHYNLVAHEWRGHPFQTGEITAVGNVLRAGMSTVMPLAFFELGGAGDVEYYGKDNIAVDQIGNPLPQLGRYTTSTARIIQMNKPPIWPPYVTVMPADEVETALMMDAGARPWDRDYTDARVIANVSSGRGWIINSQQDVHGYPQQTPTHRAFNPADWNLIDMTPKSPSALDSSHRNTTLMVPSKS